MTIALGCTGPITWLQRQMMSGRNPREILVHLIPNIDGIPDDVDDMTLWKLIAQILTEPPKRKKLPDINTMDDVVRLIRSSSKIMVLTGAGVSWQKISQVLGDSVACAFRHKLRLIMYVSQV